MDIQSMMLIAPPILFALTIHEFSHAYVANLYGDDTAKLEGRLTLNPIKHLDPIGTIMMFLVQFGWAKPVPVNPRLLRNPRNNMLWISAAGPISNMILALVSGLFLRILFAMNVVPDRYSFMGLLSFMVLMSLRINLALAIFNILPIAPLDGSKILYGILPARYNNFIFFLERYGPFILIGLIIIGRTTNISILGALIWPFVELFSKLFGGI